MPPTQAKSRSSNEAISGKPVVRRALVHATSVLTTRDSTKQILTIDMKPLVIHLLAGLEMAGIERAVITLGHDAAQVADCVVSYGFERLQVDFVYLTLGSAADAVWRNLASSVIAARTAFSGPDPFLIVRADQLYDWRLIRRICDAPFDSQPQFEAYALVDVTPATLSWADNEFCSAGDGQRGKYALAKVALAERDRRRVVRCSHSLRSYDAVVAGEVYATRPLLFEILARKFSASFATSLSDAVEELAVQGGLGCVEVGEYSSHWFGPRTVAAVFRPPASKPNKPNRVNPWQHLVAACRELLYSGEWRPTPNMPTPPLRGDLEKKTAPLLKLGSTLGQGANGVVVEAESSTDADASGSSSSRLAVKMFTAGLMNPAGLESIMWEVHVLRQICGHENIVELRDVVEMADAVYVVMERIEGPDLAEYIRSQPGGKLAEAEARTLFRHLLAALRHAHARGFLHGDVKPENVRLRESKTGAMSAVLVDWGMARRMDKQHASVMMGTPLYASPEQLTGHNVDQAWGRARLSAAADIWSLGVTLYEMVVGHPPFLGDSHEALVANVLSLNYQLPDGLSVEVRQLIDSMLQPLACDRASIMEMCSDAWTLRDSEPMPPFLMMYPNA